MILFMLPCFDLKINIFQQIIVRVYYILKPQGHKKYLKIDEANILLNMSEAFAKSIA